MDRRKRELSKLAEREGLSNVEVLPTRGTHLRIEGMHKGKPVKVLASLSPSCHRNELNIRSYIRRAMRAVETPVAHKASA